MPRVPYRAGRSRLGDEGELVVNIRNAPSVPPGYARMIAVDVRASDNRDLSGRRVKFVWGDGEVSTEVATGQNVTGYHGYVSVGSYRVRVSASGLKAAETTYS